MARTEIRITEITRTRTFRDAAITPGDSANDMYINFNRGYTALDIENTGAGTWVVGADVDDNEVDGIEIPDKEIEIPAGSVCWFGAFPPEFYNQEYGTAPYAVLINLRPGLGAGPASELRFRGFRVQ